MPPCSLVHLCVLLGNFFLSWRNKPPVDQGLLIIGDSWSHPDTPHSVGLLWASDKPDAETSTWQHTILKEKDIHGRGEIRTRNPSKRADTLYVQEEGLAMGTPTSSILSEIYLWHIENTNIFDILLEHWIIGYFRYIDDIFIVHKNDTTNIYDFLNLFDNRMPTMKFTMEEEKNNKRNFIDIIIWKEGSNISFNICRKSTTTDTIIPSDSCHPQEHKLAVIRYLATRMEIYSLSAINREN